MLITKLKMLDTLTYMLIPKLKMLVTLTDIAYSQIKNGSKEIQIL